jgi:hypothetical protein
VLGFPIEGSAGLLVSGGVGGIFNGLGGGAAQSAGPTRN